MFCVSLNRNGTFAANVVHLYNMERNRNWKMVNDWDAGSEAQTEIEIARGVLRSENKRFLSVTTENDIGAHRQSMLAGKCPPFCDAIEKRFRWQSRKNNRKKINQNIFDAANIYTFKCICRLAECRHSEYLQQIVIECRTKISISWPIFALLPHWHICYIIP